MLRRQNFFKQPINNWYTINNSIQGGSSLTINSPNPLCKRELWTGPQILHYAYSCKLYPTGFVEKA
jgi:hypothetical protein